MNGKAGEERVLVTGGSGFIGTNLVEALRRCGCEVCNVDIAPPLNPRHGEWWARQDILDRDGLRATFRAFAPTWVVHLAAETSFRHAGGAAAYAANTIGTENVLAAVRQTPQVSRTVVTSSMLVCRPGYHPRSDTDVCPSNEYGRSKVLTESVTRGCGLQSLWTIARPVTIWGPWCRRHRDELFPLLRRGHYLHPPGRPVIRTYGYVGNVAHQIRALLRAEASQVHGRTFYVGDPPLDLRAWVDGFSLRLRGRRARVAPRLVLTALAWSGDLLTRGGIRFPLTRVRLDNMTTDNAIDMSDIIGLAGAGPHSMEEGIAETVRWLQADAAGDPA